MVTFINYVLSLAIIFESTSNLEEDLNVSGNMKAKRIIGGEYTGIKVAPHSVFLMVGLDDEGWTCVASVVNQQILLTAAHCIDTCEKHCFIDATAGSVNIETAVIRTNISNYVHHPSYNKYTGNNDVAILLTSSILPLGKNIRRVIIKPSFEGTEARVSGWGITREESTYSSTRLKTLLQTILSRRECAKCSKVSLGPGKMCAYSTNHRVHYPSKGDSGAALVTADHQQIGLVSSSCPARRDVIIYSNVSYFYSWIKKNSHFLYCLQSK